MLRRSRILSRTKKLTKKENIPKTLELKWNTIVIRLLQRYVTMKASSLTVLVQAVHPNPLGPIGGGWFRFLELLKRGARHGINYVLIETEPSFAKALGIDYDFHEVDSEYIEYNIKSMFISSKKVLKTSLRKLRDYKIDLIYSPVEIHPTSFLPYPTALLDGLNVPWTIMLQLVPLYGSFTRARSFPVRQNLLDPGSLYRYLKFVRDFPALASFEGAVGYRLLFEILARAPRLLAVSKSVKVDLGLVDPRLLSRTIVVYPGNGIDVDRIKRVPNPSRIYDAIFVNSWALDKGLWDTVSVWSEIVKEFHDAQLAIVGRMPTYPSKRASLLSRLKSKIRKLNLERNIVLVGDLTNGFKRQEDIWFQMKRARILLYPSYVDSWGLVVGEALACGLPVVGYRIPALYHSYGRCSAVTLVQVGNTGEFAKESLKLLMDNHRLRKLRTSATNDAKQYFSWDQVIEAEKSAYQSVIESTA